MYDIEQIRRDFPILSVSINGHPNTFLDTAASAQKPQCVIDAISQTYAKSYANVHRGAYYLSEEMTIKYEQARAKVRKFLNAASEHEIVFTRNATEALNLVAYSWGRKFLKPGDEVLISQAEHHANLIPWQILRDEIGIKLQIFKIADDGSYVADEFLGLLSEKTKLVSVTAMSNVLGTVFPIADMVKAAHRVGALFMVDACQYAAHRKIDVQNWDCDFLAFSGHKTYGPSGIGVLYGKMSLLEQMPPYQVGGDMVDTVSYDHTTYALPPARFEAGTPAMVDAIGLGVALDYMQNLGWDNLCAHEEELIAYTNAKLQEIPGLKIIGTAADKGGVFSFDLNGIHAQDVAFILDKEGVAVRTGHHCAEPLIKRMGYTSLARASLGLYTSYQDIDRFVSALKKAQSFF